MHHRHHHHHHHHHPRRRHHRSMAASVSMFLIASFSAGVKEAFVLTDQLT